jgi:hypothetical protein
VSPLPHATEQGDADPPPACLTLRPSPALPPRSREWGRQGRRLRVEFAKNDANVRAREGARRAAAEPNKTLFVAGFDPRTTRTRDVEKAFEGFGRLKVSACPATKTSVQRAVFFFIFFIFFIFFRFIMFFRFFGFIYFFIIFFIKNSI